MAIDTCLNVCFFVSENDRILNVLSLGSEKDEVCVGDIWKLKDGQTIKTAYIEVIKNYYITLVLLTGNFIIFSDG